MRQFLQLKPGMYNSVYIIAHIKCNLRGPVMLGSFILYMTIENVYSGCK